MLNFSQKKKLLTRAMLSGDRALLGKKIVTVPKLTPRLYRKAFGSIGALPSLIANVIQAPKEDKTVFALSAYEIGMSEIVEVVAELTELDREYLEDEVGVDELTEFLKKLVEKNNVGETVKNLLSLLQTT